MKELKSQKNKRILLGVTSSVACYKSLEIASRLVKKGCSVKAVLSPNASKLISPILFEAITKDEVFTEQFDERKVWKDDHISLSCWADVFLIAPATANTISKIACGICDNLLTTLVLARKCPLFIAPAMEETMWKNRIIQENISKIKKMGIKILGPERGFLASRKEGIGRMMKPQKIVEKIL